VITGASSGIGEAMARELARRGHQLVLVARNADRLNALAESLSVPAYPLPADLAQPADRAALPGRVAALGLIADILVNNAAVSYCALVAKSVPYQQLNLVEVDVAAVVDLCSRFLPGMVDRGRGAVLNVSSIGGFGPVPGQAAYGAAKAFVLSYTETLRSELRGTGVTATVLCPGPVATDFFDKAGFSKGEIEAVLPSIMWKSVDKVALAGIDGLAAGKGLVVPGLVNRVVAAFYRVVPHEWLLGLLARQSPAVKRELALNSSVRSAHPYGAPGGPEKFRTQVSHAGPKPSAAAPDRPASA
jgi:short-subunit dehydrogenase